MKTIRYKVKGNRSITPCPYQETAEEAVIRVGTNNCRKCIHFINASHLSRIVKCACPYENTFNDGVNASISAIESIFDLEYPKDRVFIVSTLKKLRK